MNHRSWLWLGTVLNAIIFLPAAAMAYNAVALAAATGGSGVVVAVAFLFVALPIFSLLAPFAAWRLHGKRIEDRNAVIMMIAPLVYAAFLILFLLAN